MATRVDRIASILSSSPAAGSAGKDTDATVAKRLLAAAREQGLDVAGGKIRRTSSRFCLGVEHGDYNGTELFGVGTDRYIWSACASRAARRPALNRTPLSAH
jgi:galactokinase